MPRIAVLQMTSGIDSDVNYSVIEQAVKDAKAGGAVMLFTPEMSLLLDRDRKRASHWIESEAPRRALLRLQLLADQMGLDIALGSLPMTTSSARWANRSYYIRAGEDLVSSPTYDKIHMFDVQLATGESWRESSAYQPGEEVVTVQNTPVGRLGLTICYDMRFPALFEELGQRKCDVIAVPAAFTVPTGRDHWHVMLRARAIEASAFVIAAAQVGQHEDGRETFGHSLVVDPWGKVLLDMGGDVPGLAYCDIDLSRIEEVRSQLPSLANRRSIAN